MLSTLSRTHCIYFLFFFLFYLIKLSFVTQSNRQANTRCRSDGAIVEDLKKNALDA